MAIRIVKCLKCGCEIKQRNKRYSHFIHCGMKQCINLETLVFTSNYGNDIKNTSSKNGVCDTCEQPLSQCKCIDVEIES